MKHVLVVEDDPMSAKLFEMILSRKGHFQVGVSDKPGDILARARSGEVDLVVMDVSLGDATYEGRHIDGVGITRLLKQDATTRSIPVVLATAHAMQGDRERLLAESGAEGYIAKPILDHDRFLGLVNSLVRNGVAEHSS